MKRLASLLLSLLICWCHSAAASDSNITLDATVTSVLVQDCCGRGPYVAVAIDKSVPNPLGCNVFPNTNVVATSYNAPLAKYMMSVALTAMATGRKVHIFSKDSCDSAKVMNEWVGIQIY